MNDELKIKNDEIKLLKDTLDKIYDYLDVENEGVSARIYKIVEMIRDARQKLK